MESKGLIVGKFGLGLTVFMIIAVFTLLVMMIFGGAPFIVVISFLGITLYTFYVGAFAITKFHIDENGITTESLISCYSKKINWNDVMIIEETILSYTNRGRGGFGEYYTILMTGEIERERGLKEMMKNEKVLCIPVTKESKSCMMYFAQKYQLNIIGKTKLKGN